MKIIIRISIAICLLTTLNIKAQHSTKYKEFNVGLFISSNDDLVFPGASFLRGKTIYVSNAFLIDYEYGFALPTLLTGKIGCGLGNNNHSLTFGLRPWPASLYLQYTLKEKHLLSIEFMSNQYASDIYDLPLIINYGYRW